RHLEMKSIDYLFWGCRSEADLVYQDTVMASGAKTTYVFSDQPSSETGYIDLGVLKTTLDQPLSAYDFYICGPPPMMKTLYTELKEYGIDPSCIHQEKFSL